MQVAINDNESARYDRRHESVIPFEIDFYAGELRIAILRFSRVLNSINVFVDPDILKLTRNDYSLMLADIASSTRALYRFGQISIPSSGGPAQPRLDLATLELLRMHFDSFESAVGRVADQPLRTLRSERAKTSILLARQISEKEIDRAMRAGSWRNATLAERRAAPRLVKALGGRWIPQVAEEHKSERLDVYENRALLGFMRWLDSRLRTLVFKVSALHAESEAPGAAIWLDRLRGWQMRLGSLQRRDTFAGLKPDQSVQCTSVFRVDPNYAAAFRAMMRIRSGLGTGDVVSPSVPIERTYELFEMWCYIGVLRAVTEMFPDSLESVRRLLAGASGSNSLGVELARGDRTRVQLGPSMALFYQRRYSKTPSYDGTKTLAIDAIPDISIVGTASYGSSVKIVVLDPKYRIGASLDDGLRDLHVYRDAIMDSDSARVVIGAVALAPRMARGELPYALPTNVPIAVEMRPGCGREGFRTLLESAVRSLS
jgi:hypothetical protein